MALQRKRIGGLHESTMVVIETTKASTTALASGHPEANANSTSPLGTRISIHDLIALIKIFPVDARPTRRDTRATAGYALRTRLWPSSTD